MAVQHSPEKSNSVPDMSKIDDESPTYVMARNKKRRPSTSLPQLQELTKEVTSELHELFDRFASEQDKKITAILNSLKDIQQTNSMIQSSITYLCEENSEMKNKIAQLESEFKRDKEQILLLESKFEDTQRNDCKCNIEIRNVPINGNESKSELFEMISQLAKNINVDMTKQDIKDILKINKNKNKKEKSTIVVEFTNTFIKTCILKGAKTYNIKNRDNKLKALHLGLKTNNDIPIFISENLTTKASRLHFLARDLKMSKNYKYCWTSYGKVYLRLDDDSPIIVVTSEAQVHQLANK
jgi:hypothetical protein